MNNKIFKNQFRFGLYQEDVILGEKTFDADVFNPFTRYSIDIREILPSIITDFQKILSKKSYQTTINVGYDEDIITDDSSEKVYDLHEYHTDMVDSYPNNRKNDFRYLPKIHKHYIDNKVIRGVECKIGLYINANPIVERVFFVDGFNPISRYSSEVTGLFMDIADLIIERIKKSDVCNMWDDYDLINRRGMSISQIRNLPLDKRIRILKNMKLN